MKNLLALLLFVPSLCLAQSVTLPYNPDANADSAIGAPDLLEMLPLFGGYFTPDPILIDGMEINEYLNMLEENGSSTLIEGSEHGQMLYWNGEEWVLVSVGENGQFLGLIDNTPVWQDLPTGAGVPEVGCADQTACNYDSGASVNWAPLCVYEDECGVCDGPGTIYECGCADLPEGGCDCDGNQLDALNVCGGICAADVDGDGICDDGDDCIGEADECGVCNGPGAIYECGCTGIAPDECDCAGTPDEDQDGICDTEDPCIGVADSDGDGICDDVDDCDGTLDLCGVCNGPGPVYECGCSDIPEGDCDCAGNTPDTNGDCQDCLTDSDGDGIFDSYCGPCLGQDHLNYQGHEYPLLELGDRCWFADNLRVEQLNDGTEITYLYENGPPEVYGYLYVSINLTLCPSGWHPSKTEEWDLLISAFGGPQEAGGALKQAGTELWNPPNTGATNISGFNALPNGFAVVSSGNPLITGLGEEAAFSANSGAVYLNTESTTITITPGTSNNARSVRCVADTVRLGCTDPNYLEFDELANVPNGNCSVPAIYGCTDSSYVNFNPAANVNEGCNQLLDCQNGMHKEYWGYNYTITTINGDCWFTENLRSTKFNNGIQIPYASGNSWNSAGGDCEGTYCPEPYPALRVANNDSLMLDIFGYQYNGFVIRDSSEICPTGWSAGSQSKWENLFNGANADQLCLPNPLNEYPSGTWPQNPTNSLGFSALPGGWGLQGGWGPSDSRLGSQTLFWTTYFWNGYTIRSAIFPSLSLPSMYNSEGAYIRCVRD